MLLLMTWVQSAQVITYSQKSELDKLLLSDQQLLIENCNASAFQQISETVFISQFYEGISQCLLFLEQLLQRENLKMQHRRLKKTITHHEAKQIGHPILPNPMDKRIKKILQLNSDNGDRIFDSFSGKWFGHWNNYRMEHHWLPPKAIDTTLLIFPEVSLQVYQTAYTGDGFGWNYQIKKNGTSLLMGYVCHINAQGQIIQKRPHIGLPQPDNSIIWITKDHIYFEYICPDPNHKNVPKHYVITGAQFRGKEMVPKTHFAFQEIYFSKFQFNPNLSVKSHLQE